jgi:hypothetical protein
MFKDSSDRGDGLSMNFAVGHTYFHKKRRSDEMNGELASHSVSEFQPGEKAAPFANEKRNRNKYATSSDQKHLYASESKRNRANRLHELSKAKLLPGQLQ